ncbi:MAG: hypothetical protein ACP5JE_03820, partial [Thermoplasmata archaeon]
MADEITYKVSFDVAKLFQQTNAVAAALNFQYEKAFGIPPMFPQAGLLKAMNINPAAFNSIIPLYSNFRNEPIYLAASNPMIAPNGLTNELIKAGFGPAMSYWNIGQFLPSTISYLPKIAAGATNLVGSVLQYSAMWPILMELGEKTREGTYLGDFFRLFEL